MPSKSSVKLTKTLSKDSTRTTSLKYSNLAFPSSVFGKKVMSVSRNQLMIVTKAIPQMKADLRLEIRSHGQI